MKYKFQSTWTAHTDRCQADSYIFCFPNEWKFSFLYKITKRCPRVAILEQFARSYHGKLSFKQAVNAFKLFKY